MNPQPLNATVFDTRTWMTLRWTRGTRYVRAHLEQDLWRTWVVTQVHGRVNSALGCARSIPAITLESALLHLAAIAKRREQRGYTLTV
jgi:hypothetical protein